MTVIGTVRDGKIVLPEGVSLPDGVKIAINLPPQPAPQQVAEAERSTGQLTHREKLLALAGTVDGLPDDLSINHDHYLYGTPKQKP